MYFLYGVYSAVYDFLDFLPVILIGIFLLHDLSSALTFIIVLSILRQYTGGIHASTVFGCVISYCLVYIAYYQLSEIFMSYSEIYLIAVCCGEYQLVITPTMNKNKPMTDKQLQICGEKARGVLSLLLILMLISYSWFPTFSVRIAMIIITNFLLIIAQRVANYESDKDFNSR